MIDANFKMQKKNNFFLRNWWKKLNFDPCIINNIVISALKHQSKVKLEPSARVMRLESGLMGSANEHTVAFNAYSCSGIAKV